MENVPDFACFTIGIDLGESWRCVGTDENSGTVVSDGRISDVPSTKNYNAFQHYNSNTGRYAVMVLYGHDLVDQDFNGVLDSFYIEKTDSFDLDDSGINLYNGVYVEWKCMAKADGTDLFDSVSYSSPRMLEADEFMYGDVTGDGLISGSDAMWTLSTYNQYGRLRVADLYNSYLPNIRDMKAAYAADVNKDGYIDDADADIILYTYTQLGSGKSFDQIDGIVGEIDVYEVF